MITGAQIRAGRAMLRWSAEDLAKASKVGVATIRRAETWDVIPSTTVANLRAIERSLSDEGLEFVGGGVVLTIEWDSR